MQKLRKIVLASGREMQKRPSWLGFAIFHEGAYISEVRCWLELRASVLRRAVRSSNAAQKRDEEMEGDSDQSKLLSDTLCQDTSSQATKFNNSN